MNDHVQSELAGKLRRTGLILAGALLMAVLVAGATKSPSAADEPSQSPAAVAVATQPSPAPAPPATVPPPQPMVPTPPFSFGVSEVLKLVDAKVDVEVVKAYIRNSSLVYHPTANEIIALKERGVPSELLAAMLQHDSEAKVRRLPPRAPMAPPRNPGGPAANGLENPYDSGAPLPPDYGYDDGYPIVDSGYPYDDYGWDYYEVPWIGVTGWWPWYRGAYYHGYSRHFVSSGLRGRGGVGGGIRAGAAWPAGGFGGHSGFSRGQSFGGAHGFGGTGLGGGASHFGGGHGGGGHGGHGR